MSGTIGIDMGGTKALAVRLEHGKVAERVKFSMPGDADTLLKTAAEAARRVWSKDVAAVGVGLAGLVQWPDGRFVWGPHVAGTNVPLREELASELGIETVVDNDANAAALAELRLGAARGHRDFVLVTLGTGIGGALVIDGKVARGASFSGEWGHMLYQQGGHRCDCGKQGCWETVASGPALVRLAREFIAQDPDGPLGHRLRGREITGEAITQAADDGDETARGLVAEVGADLGRGLCNLIAALDPEIVVIGGGLGSGGESLLGPARRVAADALHGGSHRTLPPIVVAALGEEAGAIGAALLAADLAQGKLTFT